MRISKCAARLFALVIRAKSSDSIVLSQDFIYDLALRCLDNITFVFIVQSFQDNKVIFIVTLKIIDHSIKFAQKTR